MIELKPLVFLRSAFLAETEEEEDGIVAVFLLPKEKRDFLGLGAGGTGAAAFLLKEKSDFWGGGGGGS